MKCIRSTKKNKKNLKKKLVFFKTKQKPTNVINDRDYKDKEFIVILHLLKNFIYHYCCYKEITNVFEKLKGDREFWVYTSDAHIQMAVISWCMIFGSRDNETHHTKLVTPNSTIEDFSQYACGKLNLSKKKYEKKIKEIVKFRNKYIAHRNDFKEEVPRLDFALEVCFEFDIWARKLIEPDYFDEKTFKDLINDYKIDILKTIEISFL